MPNDRLRTRVHRQLSATAREQPGLSATNRVILGVIVISSAIVILETEPALATHPVIGCLFRVANPVFAVLFLAEYVLRLWSTGENPRYAGLRGRLRYAITPRALIDLAALAPFFLVLGTNDAFLLRLVRLLRILVLARLGAFSAAAHALGRAVIRRRYELFLSLAVAMSVLLAAAILLYFTEHRAQPETFGSIPRALWWSIATLTTVGYGDVYPITVLGRIAAGITALAAIGVIAMPTGILAAAFSDAFQKEAAATKD